MSAQRPPKRIFSVNSTKWSDRKMALPSMLLRIFVKLHNKSAIAYICINPSISSTKLYLNRDTPYIHSHCVPITNYDFFFYLSRTL